MQQCNKSKRDIRIIENTLAYTRQKKVFFNESRQRRKGDTFLKDSRGERKIEKIKCVGISKTEETKEVLFFKKLLRTFGEYS